MDGVANQVSVAIESAYGTAVAPTASLPVKASDGINVVQEVLGAEAIKTTAPKNKRMFLGKRSYEGGYDMDVYPLSFGYVLKSALGTLQSAAVGGETLVYKHTVTESVSKPSMTVEQVVGTSVKRIAGYVINSFKISGKAGETIGVSFSGKGKVAADATKITASYETSRPFNFADVTALSIGATDIKAKVESFEIEYVNDVNLFHALGSADPVAKYVKQSTVKGKIVAFMDDTTKAYIGTLIAGTEQAITLTITGDAIGSASHDLLTVLIPKASFTKTDTKLDFDYNAITLEFEGREDTTDGLMKVELTNLKATYVAA